MTEGRALIWRSGIETLRIDPWGADALRVRAHRGPSPGDLPGALSIPPVATEIRLEETSVVNGRIGAALDGGRLRFFRADTDAPLLAEKAPHFYFPPARHYRGQGGHDQIEASFEAYDGERLYGLGQHGHGRLDQKGCVVDLAQRNGEVAIPLLLSSRGYGFLWNHPGTGRVELGANLTRWVADAARGLDYWITAGDGPVDLLARYAEVTGRAPRLPDWASGFWQSRLRYRNQEELLSVAREHRRRGLPLSAIVVDFFHWPAMGDWRFDPKDWPDPAGMVSELRALGVELVVSVWPTVTTRSPTLAAMEAQGLLVTTERGVPAHTRFVDSGSEQRVYLHYYDATNPQARRFLQERIADGYRRFGVRTFWLDACEPEMRPMDPENLRFHLGNGAAVASIYPLLHAQGFAEAGAGESLLLCRSAWAGSQRHGVVVWSGDVRSTFEALRAQLPAALNLGLSGLPWWTSDIGGFYGGDPANPRFRELLVRWFQLGVFSPICRLHGYRLPTRGWDSGAPNEIWSFGEEVYAILRRLLDLRERLRPYVHAQLEAGRVAGAPLMRPLFFDFPEDPRAAAIEDQYLFGSDLLVAPVLEEGARERDVYLPAGATWWDTRGREPIAGGQTIRVPAPLDVIPVFERGEPRLGVFGPDVSPRAPGPNGGSGSHG
jgi:alpha-D-xyloside xylohydrolase